MPDAYPLLGASLLGHPKDWDQSEADLTVKITKEALEIFNRNFDYEVTEKADGTIEVHFFKVKKND
jgi:hypothetical protein